MANSVKKEKKRLIIDILIIVVVAIITMAIVWILTSGKTTNSVTTFEQDSTGSVVCTLKKTSDESKDDAGVQDQDDTNQAFFTDARVKESTETVKVVLTNGKMDKIFYSFDGKTENEKVAEQVAAQLLANQNEYLGKYGVALNTFSPSFSNVGDMVEIRLFGRASDISAYTGKLFYISSSEYNKVKSFSADMIKKTYTNKGFSCVLQD